VQSGIPTQTPLAQKLWQVSRLLGDRSPFDPYILEHNEAQLDFILEMYALENPRRARFIRPGQVTEGLKRSQSQARWVDVLRGPALQEWLSRRIIRKNVRPRAAPAAPGGAAPKRTPYRRAAPRRPGQQPKE
jgi:hypothetical protein